MTRSVNIQAIRHTIRRRPNKIWPGQTRCGIDFHFNKHQMPHPWSTNAFVNSRHGTATNKGASCLDCVMFDDMLEE